MDKFCDYCLLRINDHFEKPYSTCDKCQTVACKFCFSTGVIPIIYWKSNKNNQHINRSCNDCYLDVYRGQNSYNGWV